MRHPPRWYDPMGHPTSIPRFTTYPEQYQDLILSQNYIRWDHLFCARWSNQWSILHSNYPQRVGLDSKLASGSAWVCKIGRKILQQWFDLWKIRNSERHGQDIIEQRAIRRTFLKSQLDKLYALRDSTMPIDRHMFLADPSTHLALQPNLDNIERWINLWQPAILSSVKQAKDLVLPPPP
jgi:hypothetical protein